jgi:hypothetical protein
LYLKYVPCDYFITGYFLDMPDAPKCVEDHESDAPARLQQAEDDQRDGGELHGLVK